MKTIVTDVEFYSTLYNILPVKVQAILNEVVVKLTLTFTINDCTCTVINFNETPSIVVLNFEESSELWTALKKVVVLPEVCQDAELVLTPNHPITLTTNSYLTYREPSLT